MRWLDRCISAHRRDDDQSIFPIVQGKSKESKESSDIREILIYFRCAIFFRHADVGGLQEDLREACAAELLKRNVRGYAVGGLSGGECKDDFCRIVDKCTDLLPDDKPRYLMGVGFAEDLVVCVALGIDMFDCVFPTRTAVCIFNVCPASFK